MTKEFNLLAAQEGHNYYYSDEIKLLLETHVEYLRNNVNSRFFNVTPQLAYKYEGDFYGLLTALSVPFYYHWITMRINGLNSPFENTASQLQYIQPSFEQIEIIINQHRSANGLRA